MPNRRKIQTKIQMKSLTHYIQEKLVIKKRKIIDYKYFPKTKKELRDIIEQRIKEEGNEVDLNAIDVSNITDMSDLFYGTNFNGNISNWDVSNVTNMRFMFNGDGEFNQDISNWNVSNVTDMRCMFSNCKKFNKDISKWNVSNVTDMYCMFFDCSSFNKDISKWDVSNIKNNRFIFDYCPIEEKYKPKFK